MIYLLRNYVELAYIFIKGRCNVDYFLFRFEISRYEYKNDIMIIKKMAPYYGVNINDNEGTISMEIIDKSLYEKMFKSFSSCYYMYRFSLYENDSLITFFISSRILDNQRVNVDDLAQEIGYSKSNLRNPLKKARAFLSEYSIQTFHKPYYGLYAKGSEFDIRLCLCDIYIKLIPEIIDVSNNLNLLKNYDYNEIYNTFVLFCMENNIFLTAADNKSICHYLTITKNRLSKGMKISEISIEEEILCHIEKNKNLFDLANQIFDLFCFEKNNKEVLAFIVVLFIHNIDTSDLAKCVNKLFFSEKQLLTKNILQEINDVFHIDIKDQNYLFSIDNKISEIIIKNHTNRLVDVDERGLGRHPNTVAYPLCYFINLLLKKTVSQFYNTEIDNALTEGITDIIYCYIESLMVQFDKYNIAVTSRFNQDTAVLLKNNLMMNIDKSYTNSMEVFNFVQLLNGNNKIIDNIDLIISDVKIKVNKKVLVYTEVNNSMVKLESFLRFNRNICKCLGVKTCIISKNLIKDNNISFEEILANNSDFSYEEIHEKIKSSYIYKGVVLVFFPTNENEFLMQLGGLSESVLVNQHKVYNYVLIKGRIDETNARIVNVMLHELIYDPIFMETVITNPSLKTLNDHINMLVK